MAERDYKREYKVSQSSEKAKDARVRHNRLRREYERLGRVSKGDGMEISHKKALANGGSDAKENLTIKTRSANRRQGKGLSR